MQLTEELKKKIEKLYLSFNEKGENGFVFSETGFPNLKIYFQEEPKFVLANIMEIDGVQVYIGKDENLVSNPLKEYGENPDEID